MCVERSVRREGERNHCNFSLITCFISVLCCCTRELGISLGFHQPGALICLSPLGWTVSQHRSHLFRMRSLLLVRKHLILLFLSAPQQGTVSKYKTRELHHTEGKKKKKNHLNPLSHELIWTLESLTDSRADEDK